jgi:hypothetical protein
MARRFAVFVVTGAALVLAACGPGEVPAAPAPTTSSTTTARSEVVAPPPAPAPPAAVVAWADRLCAGLVSDIAVLERAPDGGAQDPVALRAALDSYFTEIGRAHV